jgi:uncharacterized protein YjcR
MKLKFHSINLKQLAQKYGVSVPTLKKWIRPIEHKLKDVVGKIYRAKHYKIIYDFLGPFELE